MNDKQFRLIVGTAIGTFLGILFGRFVVGPILIWFVRGV